MPHCLPPCSPPLQPPAGLFPLHLWLAGSRFPAPQGQPCGSFRPSASQPAPAPARASPGPPSLAPPPRPSRLASRCAFVGPSLLLRSHSICHLPPRLPPPAVLLP